jgi:hypothetical protein
MVNLERSTEVPFLNGGWMVSLARVRDRSTSCSCFLCGICCREKEHVFVVCGRESMKQQYARLYNNLAAT